MTKITHRQNLILNFIREKGGSSNKEIREYLQGEVGELDRVTIIRDLEVLMSQNLVKQTGKGRNVRYKESIDNKLLNFFDVEKYFNILVDQRNLVNEGFNFKIFRNLDNSIFSKTELDRLDEINNDYQRRIKNLSPTILKKEFERLTIELSWKSSQIEGNTYSLIDTEILIKENKEAKGHTKEEAQMILNHKKAIDYILDKKSEFKKITLGKIENIHSLIVENMGVKKNIREGLVGITGTKYRPLDNEFQIKEVLEKMILVMNKKEIHPLVKSLVSILLISYIQPFEDGNKRTARLFSNAILLANNYCPLSYRSIDENDYKKATLLFYEQNSARFFKELFIQQFEFSLNNYFL
ncbi:MAG: Fic family protein [Patescibacteria group bacterium]|nr:Fic family protein [Patescibacteria group bacterium]